MARHDGVACGRGSAFGWAKKAKTKRKAKKKKKKKGNVACSIRSVFEPDDIFGLAAASGGWAGRGRETKERRLLLNGLMEEVQTTVGRGMFAGGVRFFLAIGRLSVTCGGGGMFFWLLTASAYCCHRIA
jgi:hypothetical protein